MLQCTFSHHPHVSSSNCFVEGSKSQHILCSVNTKTSIWYWFTKDRSVCSLIALSPSSNCGRLPILWKQRRSIWFFFFLKDYLTVVLNLGWKPPHPRQEVVQVWVVPEKECDMQVGGPPLTLHCTNLSWWLAGFFASGWALLGEDVEFEISKAICAASWSNLSIIVLWDCLILETCSVNCERVVPCNVAVAELEELFFAFCGVELVVVVEFFCQTGWFLCAYCCFYCWNRVI